MARLKLNLQILVGGGLVIWGAEFLPRIASRPGAAASWIGPALILAGTAIGARAAYAHRKGAPLMGVILLIGASLWAWNLQFYFDPDRVPGGGGPPPGLYLAPATLIALGVFFLVFFRYLYPEPPAREEPVHPGAPYGGAPEPGTGSAPESPARKGSGGEEAPAGPSGVEEDRGADEPPAPRTPALEAEARAPGPAAADDGPTGSRAGREGAGPWYRLALLAAVAVLALVVARASGLEDPGRSQVTILVLVLGSLATGLISEDTLVKLLPWRG